MSQMSCGTPPVSAIRFSLLCAKKPIVRLSGAQNGYIPSSLPSIGLLFTASKRRSHSFLRPSADSAVNTTRLPSGETAISAEPRGNLVSGGG
jgi:hypothetical protein